MGSDRISAKDLKKFIEYHNQIMLKAKNIPKKKEIVNHCKIFININYVTSTYNLRLIFSYQKSIDPRSRKIRIVMKTIGLQSIDNKFKNIDCQRDITVEKYRKNLKILLHNIYDEEKIILKNQLATRL